MKIIQVLKITSILAVMPLLIASCKKDAGQGGTSTIKGKVIVHDFDATFLNPTPVIHTARNEDTYIIYGADHTTYDDDYKTSYDGSYEFKFLQKGKYRLFAYSNDSTGASVFNPVITKKAVFIDVEITSNGSTVNAPDLIILNNNQ